MEAKLLKIFNLCLEINKMEGLNSVVEFGGYSQSLIVAVYKGKLEDRIYSAYVFMSFPCEDKLNEVIASLENIKTPVLC